MTFGIKHEDVMRAGAAEGGGVRVGWCSLIPAKPIQETGNQKEA